MKALSTASLNDLDVNTVQRMPSFERCLVPLSASEVEAVKRRGKSSPKNSAAPAPCAPSPSETYAQYLNGQEAEFLARFLIAVSVVAGLVNCLAICLANPVY